MSLSERVNEAWLGLLAKYGGYELERRMSRMESYRTYYRRWPYDGQRSIIDIEEVSDSLPAWTPDLQEQLAVEQATEAYLSLLTDRQRHIAVKSMEGYKPREIAEMDGYDNSGSTRWQKHAIKERLRQAPGEKN